MFHENKISKDKLATHRKIESAAMTFILPKKGKIIVLIIFFFFFFKAFPNNLIISNASITSTDHIAQTSVIAFDISWENSWRDEINYDAVWIFIKYRSSGTTDAWEHATLNAAGHQAPPNAVITVPPDHIGAFVYRETNGSGTFALTSVELIWNYGADGVLNGSSIDIRVLGIEMVHVAEGSFWIGDGETTDIYGNFEAATLGLPFEITGEGAITLGGGGAGSLGNNNKEGMWPSGGGHLGGIADDFNDVTSQTLPDAFPKGYNAFYCMKYEMSQAQWVTFLNMVSFDHAMLHASDYNFYGSPYENYRYGIIGVHPNFDTTAPYLPMVYTDWMRGGAYADWAGLRPMTELEFEKASRGPGYPIPGEYIWGTDEVDLSEELVLDNWGNADEGIISGYTVSPAAGNLWVMDGSQFIGYISRVGILAANPLNTGRVTSGATYWGIMDMGGNAWEQCVTVGHTHGRIFTGTHGNGELNGNGYANPPNWPGYGGDVDSNFGVGRRGGAMNYPPVNVRHHARISSRILATEFWPICSGQDGIRFVRTAP